ncbi:MAG: chromosome segregation protein SMC, partial [Mesotoga sp.]
MDNIDQLLKRFFNALEQHTADGIDEETIAQILHKEFDGSEREMLITVLDSLFGEVTKMAENP